MESDGSLPSSYENLNVFWLTEGNESLLIKDVSTDEPVLDEIELKAVSSCRVVICKF